jgi:two-component system CheB/CheR fusion protein
MKSGKHHIVAIGASAGGLEAIHEFFDNTPEHQNVSYVIIQHLSPDYKSLLVELVSRHTQMKVFEAENDTTVEKSCIYVIPNNKLITIRGDKLFLEEKGSIKAPNNAIDVFLYSLAREKRENAIAIILSGTGTDGTKGIEEIKRQGGLVIVQDPQTAKFDGMPNSAIHSGNVDFVLTPAEMHDEITNYTEQKVTDTQLEKTLDDELLQKIFLLIHRVAGFDFNYYKTPTIIRRIQRRMLRGNFKDVNSYLRHLEEDPEECKQLGRDFLIGVTKFFRDQGAFEYLQRIIIPEIVDGKEYGETLKVWVAACSTGEEAYSIAIAINEVLEKQSKLIEVKIFATDIETTNIDIASRGLYPDTIEKDLDPEILNKYFIRTGRSFVIVPKIRKQIVFAGHNIIKDPPFIKNDLVSCRNMLIYMNPVLQQRVYSLLLFAVKRGGYMFFGSSENPAFVKESVLEVHSKYKMFKKIAETKLSVGGQMEISGKGISTGKTPTTKQQGETSMQVRLWEDFRRVLAEEMVFSAIYVDQHFDIKEAIGNYERILVLPRKTLRLNILRMVPQSLSVILNSAINRAWKSRENVVLKSTRYQTEEGTFNIDVLIKPANEVSSCSLIVFSNLYRVEENVSTAPGVPAAESAEYIRTLENELIEAKNNLQVVVEDLETVNEELQSSNEELLSANEELQSSNEELQSLNEELHTLNTEHQLKIKELLELNDDLNNYFRSTDIGQIFLTPDLRIRKFNSASAKMVNFIESDLGRPITHISTNIKYGNLIADIQHVIATNDTLEREVQLVNGKNLLMRILPYITRDKKNEGVIITFVDITIVTNLNNIIRGVFNSNHSAIFAFQAIRDKDYGIADFSILAANHAAGEFLKIGNDTFVGKSMKRDIPLLAMNGMFEKYSQVVAEDRSLYMDLYFENLSAWYEISAVKMTDGLVATFTNITEKKLAEQRLKKNYIELVSVKDNLKRLNTDLENKVQERTRELSLSEERFRMVSQATNDAIWDWNLVDNKVWWGDGFSKIFGFSPDEGAASRKFWSQHIHPDDRESAQSSIQRVINSEQKQWSCEYRFRKKDGSYAHVLDRGYVIHDEYGTPYRMLGSMMDLTDLKKAEAEIYSNIQQREFLAESMPLIVLTADADFTVNFINREFTEYTGLSVQQALGSGWHSVIHEEDLGLLLTRWKKAVNTKKGFEQEVRLQHNSGGYQWTLFRAKARLEDGKELLSWVITIIDINAQKVLNETLERKVNERTEELQRINEALEASNHDLQQFASVASHDLQEPLRKIHMFSKLVRDKHISALPDDAKVYLEKIMQSSGRMKSIITNVLNFSRLSAEDNNFEFVDIDDIVKDLLEDLEITIRERNATIKLESSCQLEAIRGQIRQVFQNLISNSLKFSKSDTPPVVTISSEYVAEKSFTSASGKDGAFCRIRIQDNGIGFEEKFKENIFALFHRLHSKDRYEGTGIGLAIVKKIVEKHSGIITADSVAGHGATFTIVFPVLQQARKREDIVYDQANTSRR